MRRKKRFALIYGMIIWSAVMVCDETNGAGGVELSAILPFGALGWMSDGDDGSYDADTLFEYINGGAEVYRSFNVKRVFARRYVKDGSEDIIADVFEMNSKDDAFGVFSHDIREGEKAGIGDDSEYTDGMLAFWKGPFFVSIAAMEETESSRKRPCSRSGGPSKRRFLRRMTHCPTWSGILRMKRTTRTACTISTIINA